MKKNNIWNDIIFLLTLKNAKENQDFTVFIFLWFFIFCLVGFIAYLINSAFNLFY